MKRLHREDLRGDLTTTLLPRSPRSQARPGLTAKETRMLAGAWNAAQLTMLDLEREGEITFAADPFDVLFALATSTFYLLGPLNPKIKTAWALMMQASVMPGFAILPEFPITHAQVLAIRAAYPSYDAARLRVEQAADHFEALYAA